jgi:hypothetical protein
MLIFDSAIDLGKEKKKGDTVNVGVCILHNSPQEQGLVTAAQTHNLMPNVRRGTSRCT